MAAQEKNDFNALVDLHSDVKGFKIQNSVPTLRTFASTSKSKFNKISTVNAEKNFEKDKINLSCTATCTYAYAQYIGLWKEHNVKDRDCFHKLEEYWDYITLNLGKDQDDSELPDEFTVLNILSVAKGITDILKSNNPDFKLDPIILKTIKTLCNAFEDTEGFLHGEKEHIPHPFLYYKFLTVIGDWQPFIEEQQKIGVKTDVDFSKTNFEEIKFKIYHGGKYELYRQISLNDAKDQTLFDVKRLAYSLLIVRKGQYSNNFIVNRALEIIFDKQLSTGLLPISHVVDNNFVIKNGVVKPRDLVASPILSSFECYSDMLSEKWVRQDLKPYNERFKLAFYWAQKRLRTEKQEDIGWFPEYESTHIPVAWVTSPILLFLKNYCELLSELMNENASRYLQARRVEEPVIYDTYNVLQSIDYLTHNEYSSALLFGPPGTDKSFIAKYLCSKFKDWNYIELTPGLFLDEGPEKIIPTATRIFKRLSRVKKAVILFDAVDQLLKNRNNRKANEKDAWVTTALLPHFVSLKKQREIRYILATDRVEEVDEAIMRIESIDLMLPVGAIDWTGRIKLLNDEISAYTNKNNEKIMQEFRSELGFSDLDKLLKDHKIDSLKAQAYKKSVKHEEMINFLQHTNYVSTDTLRYILKTLLTDKNSIEKIHEDDLFKTFFTKPKSSEKTDAEKQLENYEEPLFKKLEGNLKNSNNLGRLIRIPERKKSESVMENNIF